MVALWLALVTPVHAGGLCQWLMESVMGPVVNDGENSWGSLYPLTEQERAGYEVIAVNGRLLDINGIPLSTKKKYWGFNFTPFVIQGGKIYGVEFLDLNFVDHQNLGLNKPVEAAGYWALEQGKIAFLAWGSTRYPDTPLIRFTAVEMFKSLDVIKP